MSDEARACLGSVYRITADFLKKRELTTEIVAQLPGESRSVIEKPPLPFAWRDYRPLEDVEKALYAKSPGLAADLGRAAAQYLSGTVIAPVFRLAVSLFGSTPDGLFGHLDRFYAMVVRGFSFRYEPTGPKQGSVIATIKGGPVHASVFQQIRGNLHIIYELCSVNGTVGEPAVLRSDAAGAEIALPVRWE